MYVKRPRDFGQFIDAGGLCRFVVVFVATYAVAAAGQDERHAVKPHWRASQSCGVSSAYVLLGLLGYREERHLTYADVRAAVPVSENGTTLADLSDGCRKLGLPVKAIFATPRQFERVALPAIAHLAPSDAKRSAVGHYVVVLQLQKHKIVVIDPTQPGVGFMARGNFMRQWSGYLIVRDAPKPREATNSSRHYLVIFVVTGIALFTISVLLISRRRKSASRLRAFMLLLVCLLLCVAGCRREDNKSARGSSHEPCFNLFTWKNQADLGNFDAGQSKRARFVIQNSGSIPADLEVGQPTCTCASVMLSKRKLAPGESTELTVELRNHQGIGAFAGRVSVGAVGQEWAEEFSVIGFGLGVDLDTKTLAWSRHNLLTIRQIDAKIYTAVKGGDCRVTTELSGISEGRGLFKVGQVRINPALAKEGHWTRTVTIPVSLQVEPFSRLNTTTVGRLSIRISCGSVREEKVVDLQAFAE